MLTYAYEQKHEYAQAVSADLQFARISGMPAFKLNLLRNTFDRAGWQPYWSLRLKLLQQEPRGSVSAYVFAEDSLRSGDKEAALRYLYQSFEDRDNAPLLIASEPLLDPLRSDPRFQYLLRRAGF